MQRHHPVQALNLILSLILPVLMSICRFSGQNHKRQGLLTRGRLLEDERLVVVILLAVGLAQHLVVFFLLALAMPRNFVTEVRLAPVLQVAARHLRRLLATFGFALIALLLEDSGVLGVALFLLFASEKFGKQYRVTDFQVDEVLKQLGLTEEERVAFQSIGRLCNVGAGERLVRKKLSLKRTRARSMSARRCLSSSSRSLRDRRLPLGTATLFLVFACGSG